MTLQRWCLPVVTGSVEHPIERLFDRTPVHLSRGAPVKPSTSQHCGVRRAPLPQAADLRGHHQGAEIDLHRTGASGPAPVPDIGPLHQRITDFGPLP